ncbi:hypothetical protein, partial [Sphingobacterium rhinopitheci]|uniref:hypothetical protein n=1 Tax=Sphingobacterium rhinopitheci TaxID=2781960 RepID=UPI001F525EE5
FELFDSLKGNNIQVTLFFSNDKKLIGVDYFINTVFSQRECFFDQFTKFDNFLRSNLKFDIKFVNDNQRNANPFFSYTFHIY